MVRQAHHPEPGRRANPNDPISKFQTSEKQSFMTNGAISIRPKKLKRLDPTEVNFLVIEYWNLRFICNLVLEVRDFIFL